MRKISAEWGARRIKGLSIAKALKHFFQGLVRRRGQDVSQKDVETSLIEQFLYPKFGPGQMWETVAEDVVRRGGQIIGHQKVTQLHVAGDRIIAVAQSTCRPAKSPATRRITSFRPCLSRNSSGPSMRTFPLTCAKSVVV